MSNKPTENQVNKILQTYCILKSEIFIFFTILNNELLTLH